MNAIQMDYSRLRGKIREVFKTEGAFAQALGISTVSMSAKLNNQVAFTQPEMDKACELLGIRMEMLPAYFFVRKVKTS